MSILQKMLLSCMVLILTSAPFAACTPPAGKLDLQLYYVPGDDGLTAYQSISIFEIAMRGSGIPDAGDLRTQFAPDATGVVLPEVKCDTDSKGNIEIEVEIVGFRDADALNPTHSGRQVVFHPCGKPRAVSLFISPIGAFSALTEFVGADGEISRFGQSAERIAGQRAIALPDGKLLVTGGANMSKPGQFDSVSDKTAIFDPETGAFVDGPSMSSPRAFHSITKVGSKIIVAGGLTQDGSTIDVTRSIDIFEYNSEGKLTRLDGPLLNEGRAFHTATVTPVKGNLLIYGGLRWDLSSGQPAVKSASSWEIFSISGSPQSLNQGTLSGQQPRGMHTATLLNQGKLLIVGGVQIGQQMAVLDSVLEVSFQNDETEIQVDLKSEKLTNRRAGHTATLLQNGEIVIVGGMIPDETNIFVPKSTIARVELFSELGGLVSNYDLNLRAARVFHSTNRLEDGRVLVFGGLTSATQMASKAEIYQPAPQGLQSGPVEVGHLKNRFHHSGSVLLNGSLLLLGGATLDSSVQPDTTGFYVTLNKGEVYNPGPVKRP